MRAWAFCCCQSRIFSLSSWPQVQKLLSRHKAELAAVQQAAADEARRHLDTYVAQNELAVRQVGGRRGLGARRSTSTQR